MKSLPLILCVMLWLGFTTSIDAQKTTERFIPIGESPGLSGVKTVVGVANQVTANSVIIDAQSTTQEIRIAPTTKIYLDRSSTRQPNTLGTMFDITPGATIEVRFLNDISAQPADWIKVKTLH
jgi:hypothetical protein